MIFSDLFGFFGQDGKRMLKSLLIPERFNPVTVFLTNGKPVGILFSLDFIKSFPVLVQAFFQNILNFPDAKLMVDNPIANFILALNFRCHLPPFMIGCRMGSEMSA
jgi:hypothetical protein